MIIRSWTITSFHSVSEDILLTFCLLPELLWVLTLCLKSLRCQQHSSNTFLCVVVCFPKRHILIQKSISWHQCIMLSDWAKVCLLVIANTSKIGGIFHCMVLIMCICLVLWTLRGISFLIMFQGFGELLLTEAIFHFL